MNCPLSCPNLVKRKNFVGIYYQCVEEKETIGYRVRGGFRHPVKQAIKLKMDSDGKPLKRKGCK